MIFFYWKSIQSYNGIFESHFHRLFFFSYIILLKTSMDHFTPTQCVKCTVYIVLWQCVCVCVWHCVWIKNKERNAWQTFQKSQQHTNRSFVYWSTKFLDFETVVSFVVGSFAGINKSLSHIGNRLCVTCNVRFISFQVFCHLNFLTHDTSWPNFLHKNLLT